MANLNPKTSASPPYEVENCAGNLRVYSDGSIFRTPDPILPYTPPPSPYAETVTCKDFLYDPTHDLHIRLYKPTTDITNSSQSHDAQQQLPVIFYFHGGGFCTGGPTWAVFHNYCLQLAAQIPAVVASAAYRLAPEHRIPAPMEDCFRAFDWLMLRVDDDNGVDEWLGGVADFGTVFVAGQSAGGNIAHNLAVRIGGGVGKVKGFILLEPFFGATGRTKSEVEGCKDTFLNLELIDTFWRLSIPKGETMDHPMVNPFGPRSPSLEVLNLSPILVLGGEKDLLKDRWAEYVAHLKKIGKKVEYVEFAGEEHAFFIFNPNSSAFKEHVTVINKFIMENSG